MKVFNIVSIVVFIICAALQYNDPDPYIWMPIYLYVAWLCYLALKGKYNSILYAIGFVTYSLYALYLLFDKTGVLNWAEEHNAENIVRSMKATEPWIEETREFGGLLLVIAALLINTFWLRKANIKNHV